MPKSARTARTRAPLFALAALLLLACAVRAQDSKTPPPPPNGGGGPGPGWLNGRPPEGPFTTHEVMRRAVITDRPQPRVPSPPPDGAPSHGVVRLRAVLSYKGEVTDIKVVKGLPGGLNEAAIEAAKLLKFTPAERDGRRVSQYATLEYEFNLYYEESDVTRKVEILEQPRPLYTEEALRNRITGKVVVEATFREDGKVYRPRVVEGLPAGLSESAVEAALRIKFRPAQRKGRRVAVLRRVEYVFSPFADTPAPEKQ